MPSYCEAYKQALKEENDPDFGVDGQTEES
jgi:hypothetical protein